MKDVPSFEAICELMEGEKETWQKAKGFVSLALKIAPDLLVSGLGIEKPSFLNELSIEMFEELWKTVRKSSDKVASGNTLQCEKARVANTWLLFASYFDTIAIENERLWNALSLQPNEAEWLSERTIQDFQGTLDILGDNGKGVLTLNDKTQESLVQFYKLLNEHTRRFAQGLSGVGDLRADWDNYPMKAANCYHDELQSLCMKSPPFQTWFINQTNVAMSGEIQNIKTLILKLFPNTENCGSNNDEVNIPNVEIGNVASTKTENRQPQNNEQVLSPEEQKIVDDFAAKIDVENTAQILQYGAGTQKKMVDFSEAVLQNVRTQDLGVVGDLIANVVGELKGFDADEGKGFLGFFRKQTDKLKAMKTRFARAETNVAKIGDVLEKHQVRLMRDSSILDKMYQQNQAYFKELTMYILAGKKKLAEVRSGKLQELQAMAQRSGLAEDAQAARDLSDKCDRFEKKIHDLELTRAISIQAAPQIRMVQNNNTVMVEKIQTTLVNTIPLWKNQMVFSLGIAHSSEAAAAQKQVNDITNALLKHNAERLHLASVETAKEAERGIVDIETLKATNAKLIQTFDDVMKIQADGRAKRLAAETEMLKMENDLKQKLLQIRSGN